MKRQAAKNQEHTHFKFKKGQGKKKQGGNCQQ